MLLISREASHLVCYRNIIDLNEQQSSNSLYVTAIYFRYKHTQIKLFAYEILKICIKLKCT